MARPKSTFRLPTVVVILVVAGSSELLAICQRVAATSAGDSVLPATISKLNTVAAQCRPAALVVSYEHFNRDEAELTALARDVNAILVVIPYDMMLESDLEPFLSGEFLRASASRKRA